jgi:t-SNARE complex subunit (syntaxin)
MNALRDTKEEERREIFFTCLNQMKKEVKGMSKEITALNKAVKNGQKSGKYMGVEMSGLHQTRRNARTMNIVYALAKGRHYSQIEKNTRERNQPEWWSIKAVLKFKFEKVGMLAEIVDDRAVIR